MRVPELIQIVNNSSTVAFHKFVLLSNGRENDLFCFFEGIDSHYYSFRIKQIARRNYHPIVCGNKKSVLETFKKLNSNPIYDKYKKAYFIDRDFDEKNSENKIYETPTYSIENF